MSEFADLLVTWQRHSGRNNLPWQVSDPYQIWVSEIMLQQTQVHTVLNYFPKFIQKFPTIQDLSQANLQDVLQAWAGLGYYSRAKSLHLSAQYITQNYGLNFPKNRTEWQELKGVGRTTAAAIVAFSFHQKEAILDGNVKRILSRVFMLPFNIAESSSEKKLWDLAEKLLPDTPNDMPAYTQGLMDLGATICTKNNPLCLQCPVKSLCQAKQQNQVSDFPIHKKTIQIKKIDYFWPIIIAQNKIFLTERKHTGIWPGLLTPPIFDSQKALFNWLKENNYSLDNILKLTTIRHRLTHRELSIYPFEIKLTQPTTDNFYDLQEVINDRIPKPLKSFITQRYLSSKSS
ncbi:A/G-specific adenine glycosylase [Neisseriaceae bacterium PsAf]|nr:A/G-specific adenine glycosylase [Neisseriaceae bacterium PsAf]MCV2503320.1 A/G-specific adenine glycosylase [Neisseriaceae bacterium]